MSASDLSALITEIRADFQIAPYISDATIERSVSEGQAYFHTLVPDADPVTDQVYRGLIKNYTYYSINHAVNDFLENYKIVIRTWELNQEAGG